MRRTTWRATRTARRWWWTAARPSAGQRRRPADVAKFEATARACTLAGWEYELRGAADPVVTANLR